VEKIIITRDMMTAARDYVSLAEKEAWVAENAVKCFDKLAIEADGEAMPPMYQVNTGLKSRYLMAALAKMYFGVPEIVGEPDNEWLMTEADYDRWAGSHVMNQIERMKADRELRDKCYDLLFDYKDLEKWFSTQIGSLLTVQNDTVLRQQQIAALQAKQLPEVLQALREYQEGRANNGEQPG